MKNLLIENNHLVFTLPSVRSLSKSYYKMLVGNVFDCDGVVLETYLDHKFQWPQEGLNCESLAYECKILMKLYSISLFNSTMLTVASISLIPTLKGATGNYFCVHHKIRRKHNQHFKLLFFNLNSHFDPSN